MGRRPAEPHYESGVYYPARDSNTVEVIANEFVNDFPTGSTTVADSNLTTDLERTEALLTELQRLRQRLAHYEHIVAGYAVTSQSLTQRQVGERLGVGHTTVHRWYTYPATYDEVPNDRRASTTVSAERYRQVTS